MVIGLEELLDGGNAQLDVLQGLIELSLQPLHHFLGAQEISGLGWGKKPPWAGGAPGAAGGSLQPRTPGMRLCSLSRPPYHLNEEIADLLQDDDDAGWCVVVLGVHPGEADGVQHSVNVGLQLWEQSPVSMGTQGGGSAVPGVGTVLLFLHL